ncbi:MAG: undecaprenyl-diphosphatase UppP [Chloroflexi bacterium]|nr:undecaprenyl-diphosphatase UppP [Chloroflexota bacterium]
MTILQAILLGIVQGLTEFLPVSSSGHLVIVPHLFGWQIPDQEAFVFDVLVQLGTLLAVIVYFWDDLVAIARAWLGGLSRGEPFVELRARMGWYLILATLPAAIAGLLLKNQIEQAFTSIIITAWFLVGTALLLIVGEWVGKRQHHFEELTWLDALIIGLFQALALFPGVSRSGATITGGMARNLERPAAARFSFLMAIPVMLGASIVALPDMFAILDLDAFLPSLAAGFVSAALVGYFAIRWLLRFLSHNPLYYFSGYLLIISITILVVYS